MDANGIVPQEKVPASRKLGRQDAAELAAGASRLIVAKGRKVLTFTVGRATPAEAIDAMLGPTGNLRAPALRAGKTLLVGFSEDRFREALLP